MSNITTTSQANNFENMVEGLAEAYKYAQIIAKSDLIPAHYRGKPENTLIAMETAFKMGLDYRRVMDNSHLVNGKLGWSSQFCISRANRSGLFSSCMKYRREGTGDNMVVTAYLTEKASGEEISFPVGMKMAIAENWVKNPKYKSMPEVMLGYRAATFLIRTHTPEVLEGMQTVEELEDMKFAEAADVTPSSKSLSLMEKLNEVSNAYEAPEGEGEGGEHPAPENAIHQAVQAAPASPLPMPDTENKRELYAELMDLMYTYKTPEATKNAWLAGGVKKYGEQIKSLENLPAEALQKCIERVLTGKPDPYAEEAIEIEGEGYE